MPVLTYDGRKPYRSFHSVLFGCGRISWYRTAQFAASEYIRSHGYSTAGRQYLRLNGRNEISVVDLRKQICPLHMNSNEGGFPVANAYIQTKYNARRENLFVRTSS